MAYVVFAMHAAVFGAPIKDAYKREDVKIGSPRFNELPAAAPKIPNARCKGYTWWYDVLETPESAPEAAPFRFNGRSALCLLRNRKGKYFTRGAHVFELFRPESGEERSPGFTDFAVETFREAIP
jgi:hypothetical protein